MNNLASVNLSLIIPRNANYRSHAEKLLMAMATLGNHIGGRNVRSSSLGWFLNGHKATQLCSLDFRLFNACRVDATDSDDGHPQTPHRKASAFLYPFP